MYYIIYVTQLKQKSLFSFNVVMFVECARGAKTRSLRRATKLNSSYIA